MKTVSLLAIIAFAFLISSVRAEDIAKAIIGKWAATDRVWHIEFKPDGTLLMSTSGSPKPGVYEFYPDGTLWITMQSGSHFRTKASLLPSGHLVLTDADGSFVEFRRVE